MNQDVLANHETQCGMEALGLGDHLCFFYESMAEQSATVVPFIKLGLEAGQRCVYLADDRTPEQTLQSLKEQGVDVESERRRDALAVITLADISLHAAHPDPAAIIPFILEAEKDAISLGFEGIRAAFEMNWVLDSEDPPRRLLQHEAQLSRAFSDRRIVSICEYNLHRIPPLTIDEVLKTHTHVLLGTDVCPNPFFVPPSLRSNGEADARSRWKIGQLRKTHRSMRMAETASKLLTMELERHRATQEKLARQNRIYSVMTEISRAFSHIRNRKKMLDAACQIAVETGGFKMAWIGLKDPETGGIDLTAHSGVDESYLSWIKLLLEAPASGQEKSNRLSLQGSLIFTNDIASDERVGPWREEALKRGLRSSAAFPLRGQSGVLGVFSVYSDTVGFFDEEELGLIDCMVADLSFAMEAMDAAEALRQNEEKYRALFDNSTDSIMLYALGPSGIPDRILDVNETMCDKLGYSREELLAMTPLDIDGGSLLEMKPDAIEHFLTTGHITFEMNHVAKDGKQIATEVSSHLFELGGAKLVLSTAREITERKRMEQALRESEHRYRTLFDNSSDAILIASPEGAVLEANRVACERLGYGKDELLKMTLDGIDASRAPEFMHATKDMAMSQGHVVFETEHRTKNGTVVPVEVSAKPIEYDGQLAFLSVSRDISTRKRIEEQLNRAQRLEVAGRVAGQVAHDFNNLLGPMVAYPELIKMMLPPDHRAVKLCGDMLLAAQNMADINTDMLALSRRGVLNRENVDVNEVIHQSLASVAHSSDTLKVILDLSPDLFPVSGSQGQLVRVVSNLIANACDAMHSVGVLRISSSNIYVDTPIGRYNRIEMGEYVRLEVEDSGCGIGKEIRDKVFDAFFTTKPASGRRGSGLGLTVVQALVEDHHGYIDLETEAGRGTTFTVYLPASRSRTDNREVTVIPSGKGTVLVVDDDPIQRQVLDNLLSTLGYHVEKVPNGEEAVAFMRHNDADLLILDMVMPGGIDGVEAYRLIAETKPRQKAIIMSGFAETDRTEQAISYGIETCLRKPVSLEVLAKSVAKEMERQTEE